MFALSFFKSPPSYTTIGNGQKASMRTFSQNGRLSGSGSNRMKRSKSLEVTGDRIEPPFALTTESHTNVPDLLNSKLRSIKHSLASTYREKYEAAAGVAGGEQKPVKREYGEMSIMSKLRKIRQFGDNLKRYKLRIQQEARDDTASELNTSLEMDEAVVRECVDVSGASASLTMAAADVVDRCFEPSSSEQVLLSLQGSSRYWAGKDYCNFIYKVGWKGGVNR